MRQPYDPDFSVVLGGPLYQLYLRTKLARPPLELVRRRILGIALLCWLPPLVLSLAAGSFLDHESMPFLYDMEVHTKFLIALPLLIGAEFTVHRRIRSIVGQFFDRGIIAKKDLGRFENLVASSVRLRNSVAIELLLVVFVFTAGHWLWTRALALGVSSWYGTNIGGTTHLSAAGYWYAFVSLPVLRFLLLRWYFRLFVWYHFLWRVRALPLHLNLFHPDRSGGLGFLTGSAFALAPVLVAQTVMFAGIICNRIWRAGATLPEFKMEIVGATFFLLMVVLTPLTFFMGKLMLARQTARREFGVLASRYVDEFRGKWIHNAAGQPEPLLGTSDLQSLADLGNSYAVVSGMRILPFGKGTVLRLGILILVPLVPLTLTMIPLDQIIDRLVGLVL